MIEGALTGEELALLLAEQDAWLAVLLAEDFAALDYD